MAQPKYHKIKEKIKAREQVVKFYRDTAERKSIPEDRGYWTLCNEQPDEEGSEINQMAECGLIEKSQFFGVDFDKRIIKANRKHHPEANWLAGDWLECIEDSYDNGTFNPALVYLDCTCTILNSLKILGDTMNMCPEGTLVAANFMLSNGRSKEVIDPDDLVEVINVSGVFWDDWGLQRSYYPYTASRTPMATYFFERI